MKISLNWLKEYVDIPMDAHKLSVILTDLGLEVEGMDEVESIKGGLKGVMVGHVIECQKHPNADKLSLTKVDLGTEEVQIVCGAPNVAAGQKVLVATVGTTLYDKEGEPWKIKKGKIRGEVSQGMICAEDELGLGNSHDGIIVLPEDLTPGTLASKHYNIENDYVYDIGLTPNRSDATSHIGVAKDLSAYFKSNGISDGKLNLPEIADFKEDSNDMPVSVTVENNELCPRYSGVSISGVKIKESPDWLKTRLSAIGVRPISNIVDITNFVLHEYGQPLHAFDYDKISGQSIIVKTLPSGTIFKSLDEQDRKLHEEDLMICDADSNGMCIAGVFGGINSGVKDDTTNIFLEAAHFNAKSIRRTSTRHVLRTDAAICFEKGSDPNITTTALQRAALLIKELGEGSISSQLVDVYPEPIVAKEVTVRYRQVAKLIGVDIPKEEIHKILDALSMDLASSDEEKFVVKIPTDKADVTREADVIEEILRIYGFNKVPVPDTLKSTIVHSGYPDKNHIKNLLANILSAKGFHEMMNLSISASEKYNATMEQYAEGYVYINNTSNINLDIMRPEMMKSALDTALYNQNRQQQDLKLYELGRSYQKGEEDKIVEKEHLTILMKGGVENKSWVDGASGSFHFHSAKGLVHEILERLNFGSYQTDELEDLRFDYGLKYFRGPQDIVSFGAVSSKILQTMGLKGPVYFVEFNLKPIFKSQKKQKIQIQAPSKYPSMRRDLALVIDEDIRFSQIKDLTNKVEKKLLQELNLFDVYKNEEQLGAGKKSYAISFCFENHEKTLKDKEVDKIMNKLIAEFESKLNANIRK